MKLWSSGRLTGRSYGPVSGQHNGWALPRFPSGWLHTAFLWNLAQLKGTRWGHNTRQLNQIWFWRVGPPEYLARSQNKAQGKPNHSHNSWHLYMEQMTSQNTHQSDHQNLLEPRTCWTLAPLVRMGVWTIWLKNHVTWFIAFNINNYPYF